MNPHWRGVFPAVTTAFTPQGALDRDGIERLLTVLIHSGVHGLVLLGSLGENGTLSPAEKLEVLRIATSVAKGSVPVLTGVAETTTARACAFMREAKSIGVDGFMVLPPMQYASDRRETMQHLRSAARATDLPIMIYNNPVAYRVDITPDMFAELADEQSFVALKESSDDVRRVTEIKRQTGDRYAIFMGVDDLAMEGLLMGAVGWVAGLVCAFPRETVTLYHLIMAGRLEEARGLYRWFAPLLHLDTHVKFVHYIKLAQSLAGTGTESLRSPRLPLAGAEREQIENIIRQALDRRPSLPSF